MVRIIGRSWESVPRFAKIVLVLQAVVIVCLFGWMYNEYVNNQYLQAYLFSLFQGEGSMLAVLGLGGLLGSALVGIFSRLGIFSERLNTFQRRSKRELR